MVTAVEYEAYFNETAPSDFTRLEAVAEAAIRDYYPNIPNDITGNAFEEKIKNAVLEQIRFFENNEDIFESLAGTGFSLGKFSIQGNPKAGSQAMKRVLSQNAILFIRLTPYSFKGGQFINGRGQYIV